MAGSTHGEPPGQHDVALSEHGSQLACCTILDMTCNLSCGVLGLWLLCLIVLPSTGEADLPINRCGWLAVCVLEPLLQQCMHVYVASWSVRDSRMWQRLLRTSVDVPHCLLGCCLLGKAE